MLIHYSQVTLVIILNPAVIGFAATDVVISEYKNYYVLITIELLEQLS